MDSGVNKILSGEKSKNQEEGKKGKGKGVEWGKGGKWINRKEIGRQGDR